MAATETQSISKLCDILPEIRSLSQEALEGELQPLMMAAVPNPPNDKKRVKVYELRSNDWFDKGTGFCEAKLIWVCYLPRGMGHCRRASSAISARPLYCWIPVPDGPVLQNDATSLDEPIVRVHSEEEPDKLILETKICKDDGFQKQQGTRVPTTNTLA